MDIPGLYPWSIADTGLYKAAFRRVVSVFRSELVTNVKFVWSPAAADGFQAYFPGNDAVDYVGVTVLEDANWDSYWGSPPKSFAELFRPMYPALAAFGKPLLIPELGVSGTPDRQRTWLRALVSSLPEFPALRAIGYFNDKNVPNNHMEYLPDWRVAPDIFGEFTDGVRATGL
jgi:endoglucanase